MKTLSCETQRCNIMAVADKLYISHTVKCSYCIS